jgi:hypothetical protein
VINEARKMSESRKKCVFNLIEEEEEEEEASGYK